MFPVLIDVWFQGTGPAPRGPDPRAPDPKTSRVPQQAVWPLADQEHLRRQVDLRGHGTVRDGSPVGSDPLLREPLSLSSPLPPSLSHHPLTLFPPSLPLSLSPTPISSLSSSLPPPLSLPISPPFCLSLSVLPLPLSPSSSLPRSVSLSSCRSAVCT